MQIQAILFDMNGIIIDDEHIHELAFRETVLPFGIALDHSSYLECCAGKTDIEGYESIERMFTTDLPIINLLEQKNLKYLELFPKNKRTYPDVLELIKKASQSYTLAVTSSSSRKEVDLVLQEFNISQYFSTTITADDISLGKPNPEPYVQTAKKLGVHPINCAVIEDSKSGVISAKDAGCYCIGVTTTHTTEALSLANIIVSDFKQILPLLDKKMLP